MAPSMFSHAATLAKNSSPIFPSEAFSDKDSSLNIPEVEVISSGSMSLSIVLAEPILFLRGFSPDEYVERSPSLLRGTLIVRAHKATKIKTITLTFKGLARTDWPEGIPPRKLDDHETKEIHSHTWPFFNASFPMSDYSSGANMIRLYKDNTHRRNFSVDPFQHSNGSNTSVNSISSPKRSESSERSSSRPRSSTSASESSDTVRGVKGLAGRLRRAASPSPSFSKEPFLHSLNLGPRRSFSKDEPVDLETQSKGYRTFEPGEYFYNFELPIPQSLPESIEGNFGSVRYSLEASIERPGAFRTKVSGSKSVVLVRCPADNNIEINEPIAISKQWEDQLNYEIVISGKAFPIGTCIPIAFKLTPLAKIELHRIRVYITENSEYYCRNKRVHRIEPTKKFLIEERTSKDGLTGNLLNEMLSGVQVSEDFLSGSAELELESLIPETFPKKRENLHPNSTYEHIKIHHWIKIVLRISRPDPNPDAEPGKRKHYEISIDSPIHLLDQRCTNSNVYLPAYIDPVSRRTSSASLHRPVPSSSTSFPSSANPHENRPIHFLRKPSVAPPPFSADEPPPPLALTPSREAPPNYATATENEGSYFERFASYQQQRKKSRDEREFLMKQRESQRRQQRPSTILEGTTQPPASSSLSTAGIPGSSVSLSTTSTSTSGNSDRSASLEESRTSAETLALSSPTQQQQELNTRMFSSTEQASGAIPIVNTTVRPRYQSSTSSVDIVDQFMDPYDPDDPLSPQIEAQLHPTPSAASSINPGNSPANSSKLDDMMPKLYLGGQSIERIPLLDHLQPTLSGSPVAGSVGGTASSRRISDVSSTLGPSHGANMIPGQRGRFDSSADIGLHGSSGMDDDQLSLTSTPSLWIS